MKLMTILALMLAISFATGAAADDERNKGHGAGGVRADHASEKGMEKGKAWAGTREKEDEEEKPKKDKKRKKRKKRKRKRNRSGTSLKRRRKTKTPDEPAQSPASNRAV